MLSQLVFCLRPVYKQNRILVVFTNGASVELLGLGKASSLEVFVTLRFQLVACPLLPFLLSLSIVDHSPI